MAYDPNTGQYLLDNIPDNTGFAMPNVPVPTNYLQEYGIDTNFMPNVNVPSSPTTSVALPAYSQLMDFQDYGGLGANDGYFDGSWNVQELADVDSMAIARRPLGQIASDTVGGIRALGSDGFQVSDIRDSLSILGGNLGEAGKVMSNKLGAATDSTWGKLSGGEKLNTVWGGLQTLGNMYGSFKGFQLAKEQMNYQKDMWNKTWEANKKQFNESVSARADSRYNTAADQEDRKAHKDKYSI